MSNGGLGEGETSFPPFAINRVPTSLVMTFETKVAVRYNKRSILRKNIGDSKQSRNAAIFVVQYETTPLLYTFYLVTY